MQCGLFSHRANTKTLRSQKRKLNSRLQFEQLECRKVLTGWAIGIDAGDRAVTPSLHNTVDPSGAAYVAGVFDGTADFDPSAANFSLTSDNASGTTRNSFVAKYAADGSLSWARNFAGTAGNIVKAIDYDATGSVVVVGSFGGKADFTGDGIVDATSNGSGDVFVAKLNAATGATIWFKTFGGVSDDTANDVALYSGQIYVTGEFKADADFNPGAGTYLLTPAGKGKFRSSDAFVEKLDANGNFIAAWQIGNTGTDCGYSIRADADGVFVLGVFAGTVDFQPGSGTLNRTSNGSSDVFLARYSHTGSAVYAQTIGGSSGDEGVDWSLASSSGMLVITGAVSTPVDLDPGTGTYLVSSGDTQNDALVASYDKLSGSLLWGHTIGQAGTAESAVPRAAIDSVSGNVYVGANFYGVLDFTPNVPGDELISAGDRDSVLVKYDPAGAFLKAWRFGGPGWESAARPVGVFGDTVYVAGWIQPGACDFPSGDILTVTSGEDLYVAAIEDVNTSPATATATSVESTNDLALWAYLSDSGPNEMKRKLR